MEYVEEDVVGEYADRYAVCIVVVSGYSRCGA
jgi:hypothetical protein